jgi:hypothetical protein
MFRLNRNKQKTNRNSLIGSTFFYTGTESFNVSIEKKQTEGPPKQFKREYRVAAIFPEHFQSFTVALKIIFLLIILRKTVSALCRSGKENKQKLSSKDE